jgi:Ran GTPase-activating protein (RanGAP) involved in mRNA processing and transport
MSGSHADGVHAVGGEEALLSVNVRRLCKQLRVNDPQLSTSLFSDNTYTLCYSGAELVAVFQALKENTSVKRIDFGMLFRSYNIAALVAAEYLESTKTLQTLDLQFSTCEHSHEIHEMLSLVLRALSRNTSVTRLIISTRSVRFASVAFQDLLTCTQTLEKLQITGCRHLALDKKLIAAIASGFADNTTLRDLELSSWRAVDQAPVLSALQHHPALKKIHFNAEYFDHLPSLSGLEVLLRSQVSKVKELVLEKVGTRTVGLCSVMQELERNTKVTNLAIRYCKLSHENIQHIYTVVCRNTALHSLDLTSSALGSAGLAEIAPALYRNTSIETLDLTRNGLDDIKSANVLRELIRRNKTITSLSIADNAFGRSATAVRSISEGVRSNTALQQLDLTMCRLNDLGFSVLVNALAIRNASMLELNLHCNEITSVGVRALVDDNVEAMKALTNLRLAFNPVESEGATLLADALGRSAMPNLKELDLSCCHIDDDGIVALVSALEQNTILQILNLDRNRFGERGFTALAKSLPNIKGLQQITITASAGFQSTQSSLMEGFRKNSSLVEIDIAGCEPGNWSQELKFLGQRNRFTPLLKASDPLNSSLKLGIWSRALAKVATESDVLFHVLRNKPHLVGSVCGSKKRKRDGK